MEEDGVYSIKVTKKFVLIILKNEGKWTKLRLLQLIWKRFMITKVCIFHSAV